MAERNRPPPSAEELEQLNEAFRRDPGRAFVRLGEALIALGRPREAVEVGARGLKIDPGNLDGRMMVAVALSQLHQWKEAQAELLKVVKVDRNHVRGFRLLGEVLMRRADYERALPVLQHAHNLDPADPGTLAMLRRARSGQPLDPPAPLPTPIQPLPGGSRMPQPVPQHGSALDELPTKVAGEIDTRSPRTSDAALGRVRLDRMEVRQDGARAPIEGEVRRSDGRGYDVGDVRPVQHFAPPPTEDVFAPIGSDPVRERMRPARTSAPPPAGGPLVTAPPNAPTMALSQTMAPTGPTVRPRVMPIEKPRAAAQASLRQSAAVGEHYLNNLLMGGLLDVPRVRVPETSYDLTPGKRWGRSTVRMFVYLFVLLFMGIGGAGTWYWYAEKQKVEDVERHLSAAEALIDDGDYEKLIKADKELRAAVERDRENNRAVALLAHVSSLELLLYGELDPADPLTAINLAAREIDGPDDEGFRELVLARAAHTLAILPTVEEGADGRLADARKALEGWLEGHPDDGMARWLHGRALLAAGDRKGAAAAFEQAAQGGKGPVLATIARADLLLDDGKYDEARALYDRALERSPKHPWAFIGRSLARAERSIEIGEAVADLNVGVASKRGPRVEAYKHLAMATALLAQEDYKSFAAELDAATGVQDPRFLVRVGLLRAQQGKLAEAAAARAEIRWYADDPQPYPLLAVLDAHLYLASGLAHQALAKVEQQEGLRADILRGRALFDLGKASQAREALDEALAIAPDDLDLKAWAEAARMIAGDAGERKKAGEALESLGRQAKSKGVRVPYGIALAAIGRRAEAREELEQALTDIDDEYPNPLAYRAHVVLAELDLAEGKLEPALAAAQKALELNAGYLPAHDLMCRLLVQAGKGADARRHCGEVVRAEVATAGAELAYARALLPPGGAAKPEDRAAAVEALKRAKAKGASAEQLQAAIAAIGDAALAAEVGVEAPEEPKAPSRRRRR